MTALAISPAYIAINQNFLKTFSASGGTPPYVYSVVAVPKAIGGTIDPALGIYTPPQALNGTDTIQVTDSLAAVATSIVMVGTPFHLLADILRSEFGLAAGRAWVYDQKISEPTDPGLFIVVGILTDKTFGSGRRYKDNGSGGLNEVKTANIVTTVTIDMKSRDTTARDRRHEITTALRSTYAYNQQVANGFKVGPLAISGPQDLSGMDGSAIPFWFQTQVRLQYSIMKVAPAGVYTNFQKPSVTLNQ